MKATCVYGRQPAINIENVVRTHKIRMEGSTADQTLSKLQFEKDRTSVSTKFVMLSGSSHDNLTSHREPTHSLLKSSILSQAKNISERIETQVLKSFQIKTFLLQGNEPVAFNLVT